MEISISTSVSVAALADVGAAITATISGLTTNPTYGQTAQIGVALTGALSGLEGGEVIVHIWTLDGTPIPGATTANYTPVAGDDLGVLRYAPTVDGTPVLSASYTVRRAPPIAAGAISDQTAITGQEFTLAVSDDFTGADIVYTVDPTGNDLPAGLSLGLDGEISGEATTPEINRTIVVRGTNSGGFQTTTFLIAVNLPASPTVTISPSGIITIPPGTTGTIATFVAEGTAPLVITEGGADVDVFEISGGNINLSAPAVTGTYEYSVVATDPDEQEGSAIATVVVVVAPLVENFTAVQAVAGGPIAFSMDLTEPTLPSPVTLHMVAVAADAGVPSFPQANLGNTSADVAALFWIDAYPVTGSLSNQVIAPDVDSLTTANYDFHLYAKNAAGAVSLVASALNVPYDTGASAINWGTIFGSGELGAVFKPGTAETVCYTEIDGAAATTVCGDGDLIGTMHDTVRNVYAVAPSLSNRPTYRTNGSRAKIEKTIGAKYLSTPSFNIVGSPAITLIVAAERVPDTSFRHIFGFGVDGSNGTVSLLKSSTAYRWLARHRGTSPGQSDQYAGFTPPAAVANDVITAVSKIGVPELVLRVNGVDEATQTASPGTGAYLAQPLHLLANPASVSNGFIGDTFCLVAINRELTTAERAWAEADIADQIAGA